MVVVQVPLRQEHLTTSEPEVSYFGTGKLRWEMEEIDLEVALPESADEGAAGPPPDPIFEQIIAEVGGAPKIRHNVIRKIEAVTGRRFAAYVTLVNMQTASMGSDDIVPFEGMLRAIEPGAELDLMINSPGGLPDIAEKLVGMMRSHCSSIRAVVPSQAKSAATLMCCGCDSVVMSDASELGPTDPQMPHFTQGVWNYFPAHSFIDTYDKLVRDINERGQLLPADIPQWDQIDLAHVDRCRKAVEHSKVLATNWLCEWMMKDRKDKAKETALKLAEGKSYLSHGRVIDWKEAQEDLGLEIVYLAPEDSLWKLYWEYYVRADMALRQQGAGKLFETLTTHVRY